jgi:hypothetical protein
MRICPSKNLPKWGCDRTTDFPKLDHARVDPCSLYQGGVHSCLFRCPAGDVRMASLAIVEDLDGLEECFSWFASCGEPRSVQELVVERAEEDLH